MQHNSTVRREVAARVQQDDKATTWGNERERPGRSRVARSIDRPLLLASGFVVKAKKGPPFVC